MGIISNSRLVCAFVNHVRRDGAKTGLVEYCGFFFYGKVISEGEGKVKLSLCLIITTP